MQTIYKNDVLYNGYLYKTDSAGRYRQGNEYVNGREYYRSFYTDGNTRLLCKNIQYPKELDFLTGNKLCNCYDKNGRLLADTVSTFLLEPEAKPGTEYLVIYTENGETILKDRKGNSFYGPLEKSMMQYQPSGAYAELAVEMDADKTFIRELEKILRAKGIKKIKKRLFVLADWF